MRVPRHRRQVRHSPDERGRLRLLRWRLGAWQPQHRHHAERDERERHSERERVGRRDTSRWNGSRGSSACSAAACVASAEVGWPGQHPLRRDIRIQIDNNLRPAPPVRLGGNLITHVPMSARLSDHPPELIPLIGMSEHVGIRIRPVDITHNGDRGPDQHHQYGRARNRRSSGRSQHRD